MLRDAECENFRDPETFGGLHLRHAKVMLAEEEHFSGGRQGPDLQPIVFRLRETAQDIKKMWSDNATEASNRGTWAHLQIELLA